jgi:SAM-dependent methyltransferase
MTNPTFAEGQLITHGKLELGNHRERLQNTESLTLSLAEELDLLQQLNEFEFGRFLLKNKGLNGYWTAYMIIHGPKKDLTHPLEKWLLTRAPIIRATQERFKIFQHYLQKYVRSHAKLAAIPCGLMDSLLLLNYDHVSDIHLVGIDLDHESIELAKANAQQYKKNFTASFHEKDAWDLSIDNEYDLITSNGLNFYEPDEQKVVALYGEFYKALKPKGILITSFLTPPPALSSESTWKNFDPDDLKKQKAVMADIIQAKFQVFRTEKQTRQQLERVGFNIVDVIYDTQGMFPTIIAQK